VVVDVLVQIELSETLRGILLEHVDRGSPLEDAIRRAPRQERAEPMRETYYAFSADEDIAIGLLPLIGRLAPQSTRGIADAFRLARIRARRQEQHLP
jgi:hypothetical protein